jgi:hypothetical protein
LSTVGGPELRNSDLVWHSSNLFQSLTVFNNSVHDTDITRDSFQRLRLVCQSWPTPASPPLCAPLGETHLSSPQLVTYKILLIRMIWASPFFILSSLSPYFFFLQISKGLLLTV